MPPKTRQDRGAGTEEQGGMEQEPASSTELQEPAAVGRGDAVTPPAVGPTEGIVSELAGLVKVLLQSQVARDDRMEQVMAKQDQRWRNMQHQFQQIQHQVGEIQAGGDQRASQAVSTAASPVPTEEGTSFGTIEPRLNPLTREDDIEQFLTTFERMATACRWPQANWPIRLVPLLTGKARGAYVAMDGNDAEDYDKVKEAILIKYEINAEIYRQRFRSVEIRPDENPRELYVRLKDLFSKWVKPETCSIQQMSEIIILEQFMRMINSDMAVWIKERAPATAEEAAKLADTYLAARRETQHSFGGRSQRWSSKSGGEGGHAQGIGSVFGKQGDRTKKQEVRCYYCGEIGHTKPSCPSRNLKHSAVCHVRRPYEPHTVSPEARQTGTTDILTPVLVNGQSAKALVDTGSTQTLVRDSLVPVHKYSTQKAIKVCCVHGEVREYPTAEMYITVQGQTFLMEVAVAAQLPHEVVLGQDLPILCDLVPKVQPCYAVTRAQRAIADLQEMPFADVDFDVPVEKRRKSKKERRKCKFEGSMKAGGEELPLPDCAVNMTIPEDIGEMQRNDPTLQDWFQKVSVVDGVRKEGGSALMEEKYILEKGILYQVKGAVEALAVPEAMRHTVITLGHSVPWAGHLGKAKTLARVGSRFSWPKIYTDITEFVHTCTECQMTSGRRVAPAHLLPLPVIDTPFSRLGMDIVGPLEKSKNGNRYILVICDYATKYPEAFPLRTIKARQVANCLVQLFSRVGIPREILTDQGTNFMSVLLKQVYQLLGIRAIRTTPYHPQTDGLVERFNQTLKSMLRKFVSKSGSDWDQWLPYLLFAYREVPQASTGFSPFELLYGRQVRGPLDLLKERWEGPKDGKCSVVHYVVQMRARLEEMTSLAQEHLNKAQQTQKVWYDKRAKERSLEPGQKVLLLLPTTENKLLAKWHGPYEVLRRTGRVTYAISMPERGKKTQNFHINLLKEFHPRKETGAVQLFVRVVGEEEEPTEQYFPTSSTPQTVDISHLEPPQRSQIKQLLDPRLFQEKPGCTNLVLHDVILREITPARQKSYRIPERLVPVLKDELDIMLSMGVIEPSLSEWCSPIVLVPKKDGTLRFCIDFRHLNSVSKGAPATFQRLMDQILQGTREFAAAYLDDVVIFSETWEEHCQHLRQVLGRIKAAGLTINPKKGTIAKREISYLGFVIGGGVIRPQQEKIEAIRSYQPPTTKKQGLCAYRSHKSHRAQQGGLDGAG
ncbi:uncharacterized protein LOC134132872 [Pungitius pungitius]|uniref:uncharacterized protein LOC134132872 n=1 Tax=Pungitius pungitius TaxID=134920 RepID=UPI002E0F5F47